MLLGGVSIFVIDCKFPVVSTITNSFTINHAEIIITKPITADKSTARPFETLLGDAGLVTNRKPAYAINRTMETLASITASFVTFCITTKNAPYPSGHVSCGTIGVVKLAAKDNAGANKYAIDAITVVK